MDARVAALEASLKGIEMSCARIEAQSSSLATRADIATLKGSVDTAAARIDAQAGRIAALETANTTTIATALSKTVGVAGALVMFGGMVAFVTAAVGIMKFLHVL